MKHLALLLALLVPTTSSASTKLLLLEDIGSEEADFSWNEVYGGGVGFSADHPICWGEECYGFHSTGTLAGFKLESRDVYYVGNGDETPILCGRTRGFFDHTRFYDACRVTIEPERVCQAWYAADDCVQSVTKYRVYLSIDERTLASESGARGPLAEAQVGRLPAR